MLIEQLGLEGYGIYWVLIETLRDQPGYKYPLALIPAIARRYNTTAEKMKTVVGNYGLFNIDENDFFSWSLIKRMEHLDHKREMARIAGKKSAEKRLLLNDGLTDVQRTLNDCSTSKVNESKVNENSIDDFFESIWKLYPKKEGKGQVSKAQKQKLFKIGIDEMTRAVNRYVKAKEGKDKQYLQNGSTFFNSGYVDYLDKNYKEQRDKPHDGPLGVQCMTTEPLIRREDW